MSSIFSFNSIEFLSFVPFQYLIPPTVFWIEPAIVVGSALPVQLRLHGYGFIEASNSSYRELQCRVGNRVSHAISTSDFDLLVLSPT